MSIDWQLLLALTTAHLLGDFVFVMDENEKAKPWAVLGVRATVVMGLSYLLAGEWQAWQIPVLIGPGHLGIDWLKEKAKRDDLLTFTLDQAAHLLVIVAVVGLLPELHSRQDFWSWLCGAGFFQKLLLLAGIVLTVWVGGVVVGMFVKSYLRDLTLPKGEVPLFAEEKNTKKQVQRGLAKGGKAIGQLERGLIFFLVMIGKPEAVAFLVAAKSVFRFGELTDREHRAEAEYITIGTLMSFTWGLVAAWGTWWLYGKM